MVPRVARLSFGKGDDPFSGELFNFFRYPLGGGAVLKPIRLWRCRSSWLLEVPIPLSRESWEMAAD